MADNLSHLPTVHLVDFEPVSQDVIDLLPPGLVNKQLIVPLKLVNGNLLVAVPKTEGVVKPEGLAMVVGRPVEFVLAPAEEIIDFIKRYYQPSSTSPKPMKVPLEIIIPPPPQHQDPNNTLSIIVGEEPERSPLVEKKVETAENDALDLDPETAALLDISPSAAFGRSEPAPRDTSLSSDLMKLVNEAVISRASEVLINIRGEKIQMRQRLRGIYVPMEPGKDGLHPNQLERLVAWLKKTGDKESADGVEWSEFRKELKVGEELFSVHLFLSEKKDSQVLTARIRSQKESVFSPSTWGMDPSQIKTFTEFLERKQGFILFAGAEREGLTGNLHACAKHLATPKKHVVAVEPYMESWLSGIDTYFSKGNPDLFAKLLQVAVKHGPDVLVANPLERKDHFEICLSEALKGRLILGRSYASDCADALVQLASMGVEPYLVGSAITGVISKRTIRLNCPVCQTKDPTAKSQARELGIPDAMQPSCLYLSKGCESCNQTGFNGETDIFEILVMTTDMRNIFNKDVRVEAIRSHIKTSGLLTLRQVALHKAINGQTSLAEVVRTTPK